MPKAEKTIFFTIFATVLPIIIIGSRYDSEGDLFMPLNTLILLYSSYRIFFTSDKESLNCNVITYLFTYLFLGIAPRVQLEAKSNIWGGRPLTEIDYVMTSLLIIFSLISYDIFYARFLKINYKYKEIDTTINIRIWLPTLFSIVSVAITLYVYSKQPILLIYREFSDLLVDEELLIKNSSISLIYSKFVRPIPVLVLIYYNLLANKHNNILRWFFILLILISNFPLSLGRNYVAALYIPLLISFFPNILHHYWIKVGAILGVLIIFPFLNQGREMNSFSEMTIGVNTHMFLEGHFDNFSNLARLVRAGTITYGQQLLGVLLFFVPRSIYPDKPIATGGYIADLYNLDFDHISMNFWGEGYINFGIIGVILFSALLAYINAFFDRPHKHNLRISSILQCNYTIYLGLLFFILRGDLMSGFAYTVGILLSSHLIHRSFAAGIN